MLTNPPLIHPKADNIPPQIIQRDSHGRAYALIPNGVRNFTRDEKIARLTFSYRRLNENGSFMPRVRMSKKARLRARREARANNRQPLPIPQSGTNSPQG